MRQNRMFFLIFAVLVALSLSSCEKEDSINPATGKEYSIEEMRTLLSSQEYLPNTDSILKIWVEENSGGFKSEPIVSVRFNYTENFFKPLPNGNYEQFVIYSIIVSSTNISDSLFDVGRIKTEYDSQAQVVGKPKLLPGWEDDEDCVKVYFDCTNQNTENITLTFTYSSCTGEISFTKKYQQVIYLPQNTFKLLAQMGGSILAETQEFHPANTNHVVINLIPNQNGCCTIDYDVPENVSGGDQIIFKIFGEYDTVYRQRLPINIGQETPMTIQVRIAFIPDQVDIIIKHVDNETHTTTEESLPPKRAEKFGPTYSDIYKIVDLVEIEDYVYLIDAKAAEVNSIMVQLIALAHTPPINIGELVFSLFLTYYIDLELIDDLMGSVVYINNDKFTRRQKWELVFHLNNFAAKSMFCKMKFEEVANGYQISLPENWQTNTMEKIMSIFNIVEQLKE